MLESDEADSAQMSVVVEEYSVSVSEWSRLVQMDFDASLGESSGDGNANSSQNHGMLPAVRVEPASKENVVTAINSMSVSLCGLAVRIHAAIVGSTQVQSTMCLAIA